jgi:hypothetical protein
MKIRILLLLAAILFITRLACSQATTRSGTKMAHPNDPVLRWYSDRPSMKWLTDKFASEDPAFAQLRRSIEAKAMDAKATATHRKRLYEESRSTFNTQPNDQKRLFVMAYTAYFAIRDPYQPVYTVSSNREAEIVLIARAFESFEHIRGYEFLRVRFLVHTLLNQGYLAYDGYTFVRRLIEKAPDDYVVARAFFGPFRYTVSAEKRDFARNLAAKLNRMNSEYWIANMYVQANCMSNIFYATKDATTGAESIRLFTQLRDRIQEQAKKRKDYIDYIKRKEYISFIKYLNTRIELMQKHMPIISP